MTKDRLGEFKKKRLYGSFRGSLRRAVKPLRMEDEEEGMAPVLEMAREIQERLEVMQRLVTEVSKLYSDIITSPFAAPAALEKADDLNEDIRRRAAEIKQKLRQLDPKSSPAEVTTKQPKLLCPPDASGACREEAGSLPWRNNSPAVMRLCKTHHVLLSTRLTAILEEHNAAEVSFRDDSRKRLQRQLSIAGAKVTEAELDRKVDANLQGNFAVFTQDIVTDIDGARKRKDELKDCLQQHQCLVNLEQSIKEMHTIFHDVALLVGRQGEVVDSIQHHVQRTASYVEAGKNDLAKARIVKKNTAKLKIALVSGVALLLLIVGTIALLMLRFA